MSVALALQALAARVPVDLDRATAARAAREELAKQVYREAGPSLSQRALRWIYSQLSDLFDRAAGVSPGGYIGLAAIAVVVVVAAVALRLGIGPLRGSSSTESPLFVGRARTAAEHRAAADAHAAAGRWAEAAALATRILTYKPHSLRWLLKKRSRAHCPRLILNECYRLIASTIGTCHPKPVFYA